MRHLIAVDWVATGTVSIVSTVAGFQGIPLPPRAIPVRSRAMSVRLDDGVGSTPIGPAIDGWEADMRRRGVRPGSIRHFRRYAEMSAQHAEWRTVADISFESAAKYLGAMRDAGRWSGTTHDQAASALRCFGKWLHRAGHRDVDPLIHLEGSGEPGEPGSRALTTAEVRAIVKEAVNRAKYDRRSAKSDAAVFWVFMARTGLRYAEASRCRWRDICLDGADGPFLLTCPTWSKNRRRQSVPINPELCRLLRAHEASVKHGPMDRVFPVAPARPTFAKLREAAGVAYEDRRGRKATPHSLRKHLDTELDRLGIPMGVRHRIIRHVHGLDEKYLDHLEVADLAAVTALPDLWPEDFREDFTAIRLTDEQDSSDTNPVKLVSAFPSHGPKCSGAVALGELHTFPSANRRSTPDRDFPIESGHFRSANALDTNQTKTGGKDATASRTAGGPDSAARSRQHDDRLLELDSGHRQARVWPDVHQGPDRVRASGVLRDVPRSAGPGAGDRPHLPESVLCESLAHGSGAAQGEHPTGARAPESDSGLKPTGADCAGFSSTPSGAATPRPGFLSPPTSADASGEALVFPEPAVCAPSPLGCAGGLGTVHSPVSDGAAAGDNPAGVGKTDAYHMAGEGPASTTLYSQQEYVDGRVDSARMRDGRARPQDENARCTSQPCAVPKVGEADMAGRSDGHLAHASRGHGPYAPQTDNQGPVLSSIRADLAETRVKLDAAYSTIVYLLEVLKSNKLLLLAAGVLAVAVWMATCDAAPPVPVPPVAEEYRP